MSKSFKPKAFSSAINLVKHRVFSTQSIHLHRNLLNQLLLIQQYILLKRLKVSFLKSILLNFAFAGFKHVVAWSTNANVIPLSPCNRVIPTAPEDAVITAQAINHIRARTT